MKNLNLLFNKTYYEELKLNESGGAHADFIASLKRHNEALFSAKFDCETDYHVSEVNGTSSIYLKTLYPGVLVGTGYSHGSGLKGADEDIKCGFSFDYVSGQPYIPGSSVKGLLRSAFRNEEVIKSIYSSEYEYDAKALENAIFGTQAGETDGDDVFLDAVIRCGDENGKIIGSDYITPHADPIKNPVPIHIIKIVPNVIIEFRFVLRDTQFESMTMSVAQKLEIYETILKYFGIGAKTNVGYGALCGIKNVDDEINGRKAALAKHQADGKAGSHMSQNAVGRQNYPPRQNTTSTRKENNFRQFKNHRGI